MVEPFNEKSYPRIFGLFLDQESVMGKRHFNPERPKIKSGDQLQPTVRDLRESDARTTDARTTDARTTDEAPRGGTR